MALISRATTWSAGNKLTADALNAEYDVIIDALDGTTDINMKIEHTAAALPTLQLGNTHGSGYSLQAGDGTTDDLFGILSTGVIESKVATGAAPLIVASTTKVSNLNVDQLDGKNATYFLNGVDATQTITAPVDDLLLEMWGLGASPDVEIRMGPSGGLTDYWSVMFDGSENDISFYHYDNGATFTGEYFNIGYQFLSGREALIQVGGANPSATLAGSVFRLHGSQTQYADLHSVDDILTIADSVNGDFLQFVGSTYQASFVTDVEFLSGAKMKVSGNNAATIQTLTDQASVAWDCDDGSCAKLTLGGNRTLANLTNPEVGATYTLIVKQDGTGSRTLAYGSYFKFIGGTAPTITITAGATDILTIFVESSTIFHVVAVQNFS